jgi:hypothetical protein
VWLRFCGVIAGSVAVYWIGFFRFAMLAGSPGLKY